MSAKYVLFYESADDVGAKAAPHFAAHRARWAEVNATGSLLMIGTFGNPQDEGSMAIFTSREARSHPAAAPSAHVPPSTRVR